MKIQKLITLNTLVGQIIVKTIEIDYIKDFVKTKRILNKEIEEAIEGQQIILDKYDVTISPTGEEIFKDETLKDQYKKDLKIYHDKNITFVLEGFYSEIDFYKMIKENNFSIDNVVLLEDFLVKKEIIIDKVEAE